MYNKKETEELIGKIHKIHRKPRRKKVIMNIMGIYSFCWPNCVCVLDTLKEKYTKEILHLNTCWSEKRARDAARNIIFFMCNEGKENNWITKDRAELLMSMNYYDSSSQISNV